MGIVYRTNEEVDTWRKRDPIALLEARLLEEGLLDSKLALAVRVDAEAEVEAGLRFAEASPWPDPGSLLEDVYYQEEGSR
jgi:pyruvate dehydrogenase E1 component alpha subunit